MSEMRLWEITPDDSAPPAPNTSDDYFAYLRATAIPIGGPYLTTLMVFSPSATYALLRIAPPEGGYAE